MSEKKKYMVVGQCNPYHAKLYYSKLNRVLKYDGATPVKWVVDDNWGEGLEEGELEKTFRDIAWGNNENRFHYDKEYVEDRIYNEIDYDDSWFEGDGVYDENFYPIYIYGSLIIRDDVMVYTAEEFTDRYYRVDIGDDYQEYFNAPNNLVAIDKAKEILQKYRTNNNIPEEDYDVDINAIHLINDTDDNPFIVDTFY